MKCSVKGCDNDVSGESQEFTIVTPEFDTRRVKVCDDCHEKHTVAEQPLYIPLKEGA